MQPRRRPGRPRERRTRLSRGALVAAVALGLAAGCSTVAGTSPAASRSSGGTTGKRCGTTKTAAEVPVTVEITQGQVTCSTALAVERAYAHAVRSGQAPGNGGGGPVKVRGWTCQGFPTPTVLKTGKASRCVENGNEILELLPDSG